MGSLQDQLLQAGLTTSHKAKVAKSEKRKQQKKQKLKFEIHFFFQFD